MLVVATLNSKELIKLATVLTTGFCGACTPSLLCDSSLVLSVLLSVGRCSLRFQAPRTTSDASCEEEADPPPAQEPGGKIRALEAELALSIERERETVRKLRECGPLLSADLREPEFGTPSKLVRSNREDNRTETDTSDWDTDSESNSQDCTPTRRSAREAAKIRRDESSFSRNGALENDRTEESGAVSNGGLPMTYETIAEPQNEGVGGFSEALELEEEATLTEGSRPHSPGGWEEVAQVKAEQLEEAKLLLTAVMEGERAALETVARLELELQASREEKLEVERKGAEAAAIASAQIEALSAIVEESVRRLREKDGVNGDRWDEGWGASSENKRGAGEKAGVDSAGFRTGEESVQLGEDAVRTGKEGARLSKGGGRNGKEDVQMSKDGVRSIGRGVRDGEVSVRREERGVRTTGDGARTSSETDTADLLEAEGQDSESSGTSETDSRSGTDGSHLSRHPSEATPQRRGKRALSLAPSSDAEDDAGPSDHTDGSERERSDTDESGTRRRVSTVEELRVREAEYRAQCEELQQQVR